MLHRLFISAATWTGLGLASGLLYREVTKHYEFSGITQLSVAHTHALALGTTILLTVLALTKVFALAPKSVGRFLIVYNIGLTLTFGMLIVKGVLQVQGAAIAESPALAGVSGLGHMLLTGALIYFFIVLRRGVRSADSPEPTTATPAGREVPDTVAS